MGAMRRTLAVGSVLALVVVVGVAVGLSARSGGDGAGDFEPLATASEDGVVASPTSPTSPTSPDPSPNSPPAFFIG